MQCMLRYDHGPSELVYEVVDDGEGNSRLELAHARQTGQHGDCLVYDRVVGWVGH